MGRGKKGGVALRGHVGKGGGGGGGLKEEGMAGDRGRQGWFYVGAWKTFLGG